LLATGGEDGVVKLWETATGRELFSQQVSKNRIEAGAFSPDGRTLAAAGRATGGRGPAGLRLWGALAGGGDGRTQWGLAERAVLRGHGGAVQALAFAPDGKILATAGGVAGVSGEVMLWDAVAGQPLAALYGHKEPVEELAFGPEGRALLTVSSREAGGEVKLWDLAQFRTPAVLPAQAGPIRCGAASPD